MAPWVLLLVVCLASFEVGVAQEKPLPAPQIAVVVSQNIRPYIEAVEGLSVALTRAGDLKVEVFSLEKFKGKERIDLSRRLTEEKFSLFVAVGPGAARFVWKEIRPEGSARLYSMVLNPERVFGPLVPAAGISLNIPAQTQIVMVRRALPSVRRIGLLYDPEHNSEFFEKAALAGSFLNLEIMPLEVSARKEIPLVLKEHWRDMDALWLIPDRTVISESIVEYVIKEALFNKVPVIGYNRFFYTSGAALAFVFDYKDLGSQCAQEALRMLSGEEGRETLPFFHVWVNARVIRSIGIESQEEYSSPIEFGP